LQGSAGEDRQACVPYREFIARADRELLDRLAHGVLGVPVSSVLPEKMRAAVFRLQQQFPHAVACALGNVDKQKSFLESKNHGRFQTPSGACGLQP
jgi:hypothetical protein